MLYVTPSDLDISPEIWRTSWTPIKALYLFCRYGVLMLFPLHVSNELFSQILGPSRDAIRFMVFRSGAFLGHLPQGLQGRSYEAGVSCVAITSVQ